MTASSSPAQSQVIAAFDFDGTLTARETSLPFVIFAQGTVRTWRKVMLLSPLFGLDLLTAAWNEKVNSMRGVKPLGSVRGRWEGNAHQRILRHCFSGIPGERLRELGRQFADREIGRFVRSAGLRRLRWHKQRGHCCVLISASLDVYLVPWGKQVGFDHVLGTQLELDQQGVVTGRIAGEPCWGHAKVRRLQSHFGPLEQYTLYAYGDSEGDRELITAADHGFLVYGDFEISEQ